MFNKKLKIGLFFSALLAFNASLLIAAPTPKWMTDVEADYPRAKYLARVGQGVSADYARADALSQIANYFNSNIQTVSIGQSHMVNQNDEVSKTQTSDKITKITSQIEMIGVSYSESFVNKKDKQTYIVAYIDRDIAWSSMVEADILKAQNTYQSLYDLAMKTKEQILRYKYLYKSRSAGEDLIEKLYYGFLINPAKRSEYQDIIDEITNDAVFGTLDDQTIPLYLKVNGDYGNILTSSLIDIFSQFGFVVSTKANSNNKYILSVDVDDNLMVSEDVYAIYPSLEIKLTSLNGDETFYSWGKRWAKTANFSLEGCQKKAYPSIVKDLQKLIPVDYQKKLMSK